MKHGIRAAASGLKHFFSFGGTNTLVKKGNNVVAGNESAGKKAQLISALFVGLALRSTPVGLVGNTIQSIKQGRKRYRELRTTQPQLQGMLVQMGISPHGVAEIMRVIGNPADNNPMNISSRDADLIIGGVDQIFAQAEMQGISASDVMSALSKVMDDVGGGSI